MPKASWVISPTNIALSARSSWRNLGKSRYSITRIFIAIVEQRNGPPRSGPTLLTLPLVEGVKPVFGNKEITIVSNTTAITESIQQTVTNKISSELSATLGVNIKDGLSTGLNSKIGSEFTNQLSSQLSSVRTYQVQSTHEFMTSMSLEFPKPNYSKDKVIYNFYLPLWAVCWNLYLYRVESMTLSYHWNWKIRKVRDVSNPLVIDCKLPLAQISFYEPQKIPVATLGDHTPDVVDAEEINVRPFSDECPRLTVPTPSMSLYDCASLAFPMTEEEKALSRKAAKVLNDGARSRRLRLLEGAATIGQLGGKQSQTKSKGQRTTVKHRKNTMQTKGAMSRSTSKRPVKARTANTNTRRPNIKPDGLRTRKGRAQKERASARR